MDQHDRERPRTHINVPTFEQGGYVYTSRMLLDMAFSAFMREEEMGNVIDGMGQITSSQVMTMSGLSPFLPRSVFSTMRQNLQTAFALGTMSWRAFLNYGMSREAVEKAMMNQPWFVEWLSSRSAAHWMWKQGDPKGTPNPITEYNDYLCTHNDDGTLNTIPSDDIVKHFQPGHEDEWPRQLVLTSNHARSRGTPDIADIMKNIASLCDHALPDGTVQIEQRPDENSVAGKTVVLAAIYSEDTSPRNGADLLFRNLYLREHSLLAQRVNPDGDFSPFHDRPGFKPDGPAIDPLEKSHRGPSPAAMRLAKLMLRLMVEDPAQVDVGDSRTFYDMDRENQAIPRPLVLRADAEKLAERITLAGYSKAANTINDAVRILMFELSSPARDGQPLFSRRGDDGALTPMGQPQVHKIIRKLGVIGINGPGVPMTEEEKGFGLYRLRLTNLHDYISGHFMITDRSGTTVGTQDVVHIVKGTDKGMGHNADDALGVAGVSGYIHQDPTAMKLLGLVLNRKFRVTDVHRSWVESLHEIVREPSLA